MRMDRSRAPTAADLLADADEEDLANMIFQYGEERYSRRIARAIVQRARRVAPVATTGELAALVRRAVPRRGYQRIDPATRTFQALRIWVNRELDGLDAFLESPCSGWRRAGGWRSLPSTRSRIASSSTRSVRSRTPRTAIRMLTKRPIEAGEDEVARNPAGAQRQVTRD